jgi:hypothetical protein
LSAETTKNEVFFYLHPAKKCCGFALTMMTLASELMDENGGNIMFIISAMYICRLVWKHIARRKLSDDLMFKQQHLKLKPYHLNHVYKTRTNKLIAFASRRL